jgi:hypothetical protein
LFLSALIGVSTVAQAQQKSSADARAKKATPAITTTKPTPPAREQPTTPKVPNVKSPAVIQPQHSNTPHEKQFSPGDQRPHEPPAPEN